MVDFNFPPLSFLVTYLLPIPFMLLYEIRTEKTDTLLPYVAFIPLLASFFSVIFPLPLYYQPLWFLIYSAMWGAGMIVFAQKYNLFQSMSLVFNILFFNSMFWEIPIHIYTPIKVGFIDAITPLHFLYFFPLIFLYSKLRFPKPHKKQYLLIAAGLLFSTICLIPMILYHPYLWNVKHPFWLNRLWDINRVFCFAILTKIFYDAEPVKRKLAHD